jgi:excisionase family DNA binding protein
MSRRPLPAFQDRWVDPEEAAEILGVSLESIRRDTVTGVLGLPRFQFGRRVRFKLSELISWAEARRVAPPERQREPAAAE